MKRNKSKISCKRGFTLIELLVVVLIIGILAAVAVPQYKVAVTKSQYATLKHLTTSIAEAEEIYFLANGTYTSNFEELDIRVPAGELNTSTSSKYDYPWGYCQITLPDDNFACANSAIKMRYQIYPIHSPNRAGMRLCQSFEKDVNSVAVKVCQQETGKKNYLDSSSVLSYAYN